ncbi:MAG TPA: MBL fold metallo-hydrolase [Solirubrobacteraceae bacterium]|jgi:glyoxylase-like metal-dependent hydrolase (beta-lactamase superfamily II)|nr:MBL fold metallo-hydrolase [Solirubrobacteraceae bacterium]
MDIREFTVGPVQENAYLVRADAQATRALMIDPGEEPQRLLEAVTALGVEVEAILITHCHFDHIGAVAPVARATGAPVYCPEIELGVLADIMKWTMPGFGPFESWQAEHTVKGGERLQLADMDVEVLFTPGHSPGHVTYALDRTGSTGSSVSVEDGKGSGGQPALFSGDVLFQGSVGRVDLPGGDWATLERSIGMLMSRYERDTVVHPGHMGVTTLGREWDTNPFLAELRAAAMSPVPVQMGTQGQR